MMERVWPNRIIDANSLQAQISALRRAFAADRDLIRTIAGRGYQFTGVIRTVSTRPDLLPVAATAVPIPASARAPTNLPEAVSDLIRRDPELDASLGLYARHRRVSPAGAIDTG